MDKNKVIVVRGVLDWAKVLGPARPHTGEPRYDKGPYWSVEVTPNAKSMAELKSLGLTSGGFKGTGKLREPSAKDTKRVGKGPFLRLTVLENKMSGGKPTGEKNDPPSIKDVQGQDYDGGNLGNGTVADVKVKIVDYGPSVEKGVYLQAIRVLDLVEYEGEDFAPLSPDDEYFSTPTISGDEPEAEQDNLDDDVPF